MKVHYDISNNTQKISLVFLGWLLDQKSFEELTSDDFFSIDDVTISEKNGIITYSHIEDTQFYGNTSSNLSEVTEKFQFLVEITFEKVDYLRTKLVTGNRMQSIRLMAYQILSKDKSSQFDMDIITTHTIEIKPIKIIQRDCVDGNYELNLLIKEFLGDSKLDELGI